MTPQDGSITFIANPKAGASARKHLSQRFQAYLLDRGFKIHYHSTKTIREVKNKATLAACDDTCIAVVVAGGDGTIREAAHGLKGSPKPLLIVPSGTENLLANELGFNEHLNTLIEAFESGTVRTLDLARINGQYFTSVTGFGFDAEVIERLAAQRHGHIDYFDYFDPLWQTFWMHRFPTLEIAIDGHEVFHGKGLALVGNVSRYAIGLEILHNADPGDGLLDVCIYRCSNRLHLMKHALLTIFKKHTRRPDVMYRQGRTITVNSNQSDVKTEVDGDPGPALPVEIHVVAQAIRVMVPPNAKPAGLRTRFIRAIG